MKHILNMSFKWINTVYISDRRVSMVVQTVKNPRAMHETRVQSLGWEGPLKEEGMETLSSILAWRIPVDILVGYSPWGCKESDTTYWLNNKSMETSSTLENYLLSQSGVCWEWEKKRQKKKGKGVFTEMCLLQNANNSQPTVINTDHFPGPVLWICWAVCLTGSPLWWKAFFNLGD